MNVSGENSTVRAVVEWYLEYYQPSNHQADVGHTATRLHTRFVNCANVDIARAQSLLDSSSNGWAPKQEWRGVTRREAARRPPPFIALKGLNGAVSHYIRADRIESISSAAIEDGLTNIIEAALVTPFTGPAIFSYESLDEVFAKMADALHTAEDDR